MATINKAALRELITELSLNRAECRKTIETIKRTRHQYDNQSALDAVMHGQRTRLKLTVAREKCLRYVHNGNYEEALKAQQQVAELRSEVLSDAQDADSNNKPLILVDGFYEGSAENLTSKQGGAAYQDLADFFMKLHTQEQKCLEIIKPEGA